MKETFVKSKIFICTTLLLAFMFIHIVSVIQNCDKQVNNTTVAISAFNG